MKFKLTRDELRAVGRIRRNRAFLGLMLLILTAVIIVDAALVIEQIRDAGGSSDIPEWLIIPFMIGFAAIAALIGLSTYMAGKLRDKEKAAFVRISLENMKPKSAASITKIFRKIARELIHAPKEKAIANLVNDGWPLLRAKYFAELVESLIVKCEWNINCETQAGDFKDFLRKQRWDEREIESLVDPVVEVVRDSGGRITGVGIASSIARNIIWIGIILVLSIAAGWFLINDKSLNLPKQYDYLKFIVMAIFTVIGLGFNITAIIRKLRKEPDRD